MKYKIKHEISHDYLSFCSQTEKMLQISKSISFYTEQKIEEYHVL